MEPIIDAEKGIVKAGVPKVPPRPAATTTEATGGGGRSFLSRDKEKTFHVPGLQIMPFGKSDLPGHEKENPGCENPYPDDRLLAQINKDQFCKSAFRQLKLEVARDLVILHKYDPNISIDDSRILCDAINVIDRALGVDVE